MTNLEELISLCKADITIEINNHKGIYGSIGDYIGKVAISEIEPSIYEEMVKKDSLIRIQFYPLTPAGFYVVYHHDIELAIKEAIKIAQKENI